MTVSMVGDGIYYIAIAWQVYDLSNTPSALAVVGIAWSLPQVLVTLASGVLSDRLDRRRVMIAGDLIRLMAIGAICALSVTHHVSIPLLIALVPFIVRKDLGGSARDLGWVYGAGGVGSLAAALVVGQQGHLPKKAITALYLAWAIALFAMVGFGIAHAVWQAMLVALVSESALTILVVIWYTIMQRLVPQELMGRVSSLDWMMTTAGVPLYFGIVRPAAAAFGARTVLAGAGLVGGLVTLGFMFVPGAPDPARVGRLQ